MTKEELRITLLPGTPINIAEIKFQWTVPLIFRIPTNKTPTLAISCITEAKPPLMEGSDISLMNIGATKAYAHPLIPEKYRS